MDGRVSIGLSFARKAAASSGFQLLELIDKWGEEK
jgi:hypothetical protein